MRHHNDRSPVFLGRVNKEPHHFFRINAIQRACRLVGEQNFWTDRHGPRDCHPLDLAARQFRSQVVALGVHPHFIQPMFRLIVSNMTRVTVQQKWYRHVIQSRQLWHQLAKLEHKAELLTT